ncbi:HTH-type transcriptional activator IlvY [Glaciecola petra]|uniref:HTH-type transcriptional activator IlvY n=1 Tax=Glaciecola petra TaxID=3075602 RepID=A0ABU2ZRU1_9ALTE|nr:HTH-type transcriptional activator IlvY [Aestuariibacter sp. P117]MDT0595116.1 HTH-type transcriptional activator IlvY [Aestuariibacter sp. P117]
MDLKSLKQFQHLASTLHFSKTSEAMFVSPPTLTRSIMRLEEECGAQLFVRNNRNVALTKAGKKLLAFAETTLANFHQLQLDIGHQKDVLSGELAIFCSVTAAQTYLPNVLDSMRAEYPSVDIKLDTGDHAIALAKITTLEANRADAAIAIHTPDFPSNIHFQAIDSVPLTLIVPAQMDVSVVEDIEWNKTDVIMPARGPSKRIVNHWFAEHNIRPRVYAQVSGNEAIVSMVALGLGIGFVPRIVLKNSTAKDKVLSISVGDIESYKLGLCYLKERANEALIQALASLFSVRS